MSNITPGAYVLLYLVFDTFVKSFSKWRVAVLQHSSSGVLGGYLKVCMSR
jgi:hypothetical protein